MPGADEKAPPSEPGGAVRHIGSQINLLHRLLILLLQVAVQGDVLIHG
jgi:hypothetical protein